MTNYPSGRVPLLGQQPTMAAGVAFQGLMIGEVPLIVQLRDVAFLVALHALCSRESTTRATAEGIAGSAWAIAEAGIALRAPPAASPVPPPSEPQAG